MTWLDNVRSRHGPVYLAFADELARAVAAGEVVAGTRLEPQREIARLLDVDLTTVTRAMSEARRRGLIATRGRAGSFVVGPSSKVGARFPGDVIDLSINFPPPLEEPLQSDLREAFIRVARDAPGSALFDYPRRSGNARHRDAGVEWCGALGLGTSSDRVCMAGGAQQALIGITAMLCEAGDAIAADGLTYPGMIAIAHRMGVRVIGIERDEIGMLPSALEEAARRNRPRFVFLTPTFQNPTTSTLTARRRAELADVAGRCALTIVEDDGHAALLSPHVAPITALLPAQSYYVSSMSKSVSPGLRTAYVVAPTAGDAATLSSTLFALGQFSAPLAGEISATWISEGKAFECAAAMRRTASERWEIAKTILPDLVAGEAFTNHFGWLRLPAPWRGEAFAARARDAGVSIAPADAFATAPSFNTGAVRVCLGAVDPHQLQTALATLARILEEGPNALRPFY